MQRTRHLKNGHKVWLDSNTTLVALPPSYGPGDNDRGCLSVVNWFNNSLSSSKIVAGALLLEKKEIGVSRVRISSNASKPLSPSVTSSSKTVTLTEITEVVPSKVRTVLLPM